MLASLEPDVDRLVEVVERDLDLHAAGPIRIYLIPPVLDDPELRAINGRAPEWAAGFMLPQERIGAVRLSQVNTYPHDGLRMVLAHEVTHQLVYDGVGHELPQWLSEGVATWEGRRRGLRDWFVASSVIVPGGLPTLRELDRDFGRTAGHTRRAYALSFDFVDWSVDRYGQQFLPDLLDQIPRTSSIEEAWQRAGGEDLALAEGKWRRSTLLLHRWLPLLSGSGSLWILVTLIALLAGVGRRRKTRVIEAKWAAEAAALEGQTWDDTLPTGSEDGESGNNSEWVN